MARDVFMCCHIEGVMIAPGFRKASGMRMSRLEAFFEMGR